MRQCLRGSCGGRRACSEGCSSAGLWRPDLFSHPAPFMRRHNHPTLFLLGFRAKTHFNPSASFVQDFSFFLDFPLPRPPKCGEPHKSTKIVDFAILSWISGFCPGKANSRDFVWEKPATAQNPSGRTTKKLIIRQLSRGSWP